MAILFDKISRKIKSEYIQLIKFGSVEIFEVNEGGECKVQFLANGLALHIRHFKDKPPLRWVKNQKCADGAILIQSEGDLYLHVVELKKTVSEGKWRDIKLQFDGMIHNVLAILGVMGLPPPVQIICHVAYQDEKISAANTVNPVFLKLPVGSLKSLGAFSEWSQDQIDLEDLKNIPLRKILISSLNKSGIGNLEI